MKELLDLYFTFFKIGAFTVGGGYAMLPLIQKEFVEIRGWAKTEEIANYYAIGQCTPGVIIINTVTFLGYKRKGIPGAIFATAGMVTPSVIIMGIIATYLYNFSDIPAVQQAFAAIRVCVGVLIFNTVFKFMKNSVRNLYSAIFFISVFIASYFFNVSPSIAVILCGVIGFFLPCRKFKGGQDQ